MRIEPTSLAGCYLVLPTPAHDNRGFFARTWCAETFVKAGLDATLTQCSVSFNHAAGTVRGMHYQADPHGEVKLVRCTRGSILDVVVDVRSGSATFGQWFGAELSAENHHALYIPVGFAHGFQTLTDDAEIFYQISTLYVPEAARGVRHDDPAIGIVWPRPVTVISDRDRALPGLRG